VEKILHGYLIGIFVFQGEQGLELFTEQQFPGEEVQFPGTHLGIGHGIGQGPDGVFFYLLGLKLFRYIQADALDLVDLAVLRQGQEFPFGPQELAGLPDRFTDQQTGYLAGIVPAIIGDLLATGQILWKNGGIKKNILDLVGRIAEGLQEGGIGIGEMPAPVDPDNIVGL